MKGFLILAIVKSCTGAASELPSTEPFVAPKYGVTTQIPNGWPLAVREKDDRVFVAVIAQDDPERPGIAACELGLAHESLEDYRTRIDSNARQHGRPSGKLASNRVINERGESGWRRSGNSIPIRAASGMRSPSG